LDEHIDQYIDKQINVYTNTPADRFPKMDATWADIIVELKKSLLSGACCAIVAGAVNPFDVTKIRLQNQGSAGGTLVIYDGMLDGCRKVFKEEGLRGLAKGLEPSIYRELSYSSIRMGAYEPLKHVLMSLTQKRDQQHSSSSSSASHSESPLIKFSASLISGGVGAALCNPFDLVKTKFQAQLPNEILPYRNTASGFYHIVKEHGFLGLYRGTTVTTIRAAMINSAQLGSYDTVKHNILKEYFGMQDGFALHFCAAMVSGLVTTTAANPGKDVDGICLYGLPLSLHSMSINLTFS
jgi:hypothetical protein